MYKISGYNFSAHVSRRKELLEKVKHQYPNKKGLIVLLGAFETDRSVFRQESSFYYYTGICEPGVVLVMNMDGQTDLYIPNCDQERAKWIQPIVPLTQDNASKLGLHTITYLGEACSGYQLHPFFSSQEYSALTALIRNSLKDGESLFTFYPETPYGYVEQRLILSRLMGFIPELNGRIIDCSSIAAQMRRKKDKSEIELMYKAVEVTLLAQEAAAQTIDEGITEAEVQAGLEYMFTGSHARPAFPSIVATGKNSTILHYSNNNATLQAGDLVVVDVGAEFNYYCADITRTYPVSGSFTQRQKEIYTMVLATQEYIASIAKPGMWLSNKDNPQYSLNHLAKSFLDERGYGQYFTHSIGHFLGLDVHDVGDYNKPLQEGDVITIEPGLYIPDENIGIRIEDDYWVVNDGVVCLSEHMPKKPEEIEAWMEEMGTQEPDEGDGDDDYEDEDEMND